MNAYVAILIVSFIALACAMCIRLTKKPDLAIAIYSVLVMIGQIIAVKIVGFDLGFVQVFAPAATIVFAVTYLITDIVNEKFGRKVVSQMILAALVTQIIASAVVYVATDLPGAPFWQLSEAWSQLFAQVPRILVASWLTFIIIENLDAYLFSKIREVTKGRHLWLRNVLSSGVSLFLDTVIFITLAFYGTGLPLWQLMVGQFFVKYVVAIINIPFMYAARAVMKHETNA